MAKTLEHVCIEASLHMPYGIFYNVDTAMHITYMNSIELSYTINILNLIKGISTINKMESITKVYLPRESKQTNGWV